MTNRLADLESNITRGRKNGAGMHKPSKRAARARKPQGSLTRVSASPPPASTAPASTNTAPAVAKGLSGLVSRWPARGAGRARGFGAIDYTVPGVFGPLAQPSANACWATVFTMLLSWRRQQSLSIEAALGTVGQRWVDLYRADTGLPGDDKAAFLTGAGLVAEPPQSYSLDGWEQLLRNYGPVWVTTDEAPGKAWAIHARVITAIRGDGTPENTCFTIVDPAGGRQYQESIAKFIPKYEEEVIRTGYMRIQVVHWSADARAEVRAQSFGRSIVRPARRARRARQSRALQAVEIASAIIGATMTRILDNEGDVSWELDQLQGLQHVGNDPSTAGPAPYQNKAITITGPRSTTTRFKDQIYADTEIAFQYNGHSVGNIQMAIVHNDDAVAAGLVVKANIMNDGNAYTRPPSTERFAAIKVRIHYTFKFTFYSDPYIWIDDIVLYGDGTHAFSRRNTQ
jgi:hypothetical protein